jgi:DNA-binding transcriptional regulator LsrR (DeoR family)
VAAQPEGLRPIAATVGLDRKTVRRYIDAGIETGLVREAVRTS